MTHVTEKDKTMRCGVLLTADGQFPVLVGEKIPTVSRWLAGVYVYAANGTINLKKWKTTHQSQYFSWN